MMQAILIAEDDFENLRYLEALLQRRYTVNGCVTAEEAIANLQATDYAACIIDISLGGTMTGLDVIRHIRASARNSSLPVICLTAHSFGQDRINAMEAGADVFLKKPVVNNVLTELIQELVNKRQG